MQLHILADYSEEGWPSMDLVANKLNERSQRICEVELHRPRFRRLRLRFLVPARARTFHKAIFNFERIWNRFLSYPSYAKVLKQVAQSSSFYHVADHSYAQLVHQLPVGHTGVYCHDIDAFRSVLAPESERRAWPFRQLVAYQVRGLRLASIVFHSTLEVRKQILEMKLVQEEKLVHAPYGFSDEFSTVVGRDEIDVLKRIAPPLFAGKPSEKFRYLLHVGSCIPRKRIDLALQVYRALLNEFSDLWFVKVGGDWSQDQIALIKSLGIQNKIIHLQGISAGELAVVYRASELVLVPSSAEGFGLPVIEALACGARVLCSAIPVLQEVGGDFVNYAPVGEVSDWTMECSRMIRSADSDSQKLVRANSVRQYSWDRHAEIIVNAYRQHLHLS